MFESLRAHIWRSDMCMQCVTKAAIFAKTPGTAQVFPGWVLTQATRSAPLGGWNAGEYGLVRINDPDLVWAGEILPEPDGWGNDDLLDTREDHQKYFDSIAAIGEGLETMSFQATLELVKAAGFSGVHNFDFAEVLMRKLYEHVQENPPRDEDAWMCMTRAVTKEEWEKSNASRK